MTTKVTDAASAYKVPVELYSSLLALLDSVSRAHGMELLSVVCRPSVRRPCRNYL